MTHRDYMWRALYFGGKALISLSRSISSHIMHECSFRCYALNSIYATLSQAADNRTPMESWLSVPLPLVCGLQHLRPDSHGAHLPPPIIYKLSARFSSSERHCREWWEAGGWGGSGVRQVGGFDSQRPGQGCLPSSAVTTHWRTDGRTPHMLLAATPPPPLPSS